MNGWIGRNDVGMMISAGDWSVFAVLASTPIACFYWID